MAVVAPDDLFVDLTLAYIDDIALIADIVGEEIRRIFENMGSVDRADIVEFIRESLPMARGGREAAIDLTTDYLAQLTGQSPAGIDLREFAPAWDAPFLRTWHNLKSGQTFDEARQGGASQAEALGSDIVRQGGEDRMAKPGVTVIGWRRVVHPDACEWCQVVGTQTYRTEESASKSHHDCRCLPALIVTDKADPALAINRQRLAELKKSGAVQRATDARTRNRDRASA